MLLTVELTFGWSWWVQNSINHESAVCHKLLTYAYEIEKKTSLTTFESGESAKLKEQNLRFLIDLQLGIFCSQSTAYSKAH